MLDRIATNSIFLLPLSILFMAATQMLCEYQKQKYPAMKTSKSEIVVFSFMVNLEPLKNDQESELY